MCSISSVGSVHCSLSVSSSLLSSFRSSLWGVAGGGVGASVDSGGVSSRLFCLLSTKRRRRSCRSLSIRVLCVSGVHASCVCLVGQVVVFEVVLVGVVIELVVSGSCWWGSRRLVNLACRNILGLGRH